MPLPLKFVVIGASVAGLTCAYALRIAGHNVVVAEMHDANFSDIDGGLRVPPNMSRLLEEFPGMSDLLDAKGVKCSGLMFRSAENSEKLGMMQFHDSVMTDLGADFKFVAVRDFCGHLYKLCADAGVKFRFSFSVTSVETIEGKAPVVISQTGERLSGDIVVGADGRNSVARHVIPFNDSDSSDNEDAVVINGQAPVRAPSLRAFPGTSFTVPVAEMMKDPELRAYAEASEFQIWMGHGSSILGGRHSEETYIIGLTRSQLPLSSDTDGSWYNSSSVAPVLDTVPEYDAKVQKLVAMASGAHPTVQNVLDLKSYVDDTNSVVLIGDASHAIPIHGTYNASIAVEDAFTLARLFSQHTHRSQIPPLLKGYDEIRHPRTRFIESYEVDGLKTVSLPPGPHREMRNQSLAQTLEMQGGPDENAEMLAELWASYIVLFNYDAKDAVDEWWLNWGRHVQALGADTT